MEEILKLLDKYESLDFNNITDDSKLILEITNDLTKLGKKILLLTKIEEESKVSLNGATALGLIVKCIKLHESIFEIFKTEKWEVIKILDRSFYEAVIVSQYLMTNGEQSQSNFRKISYRNYIKTQKKFKESNLDKTNTAKTQKKQTEQALKLDKFTIEEVEQHGKADNWKLDKKSFFDIHKSVKGEELYSIIYGLDSDITHGNWREILHFHVISNKDGSFDPNFNYQKMDVKSLCPSNNMLIDLLCEYLKWREFEITELENVLKNIRQFNRERTLEMI